MKKQIIATAAVLGMAAFAFANPSSMTKTTTAGLIGDGIVDSLNRGVEGKGLIFTDVKPSSYYFNLGAGMWLNDNLWGAAYFNVREYFSTSQTDNVTNTANMPDGVTVDSTEHQSSTTVSNGTNTSYNNLYFTLYSKTMGFGGELFWNNSFYGYSSIPSFTEGGALSRSGTITESDYSDTSTEEKISGKVTGIKNSNSSNTVGINFTDLKLPESGDLKFSAALDTVQLYYYANQLKGKYSYDRTVHNSIVGAGNQITASGTNSNFTIRPTVKGEVSMVLPSAGKVTPKLTVFDTVSTSLYLNKNNSSYKTVYETDAAKTTKTTEYKVNYGSNFNVANTLTPRLDLNFDLGEKIVFAARGEAAIGTSFSMNKADYRETDTLTAVYNKDTQKTSYVKAHSEGIVNGQDYTYFGASVTPSVQFGSVYKVKAEKVHINFGCKMNAVPLSVYLEKYTNSGIETKSYTKTTDEDGNVTDSTPVTAKQGNGVNEKRTVSFSSQMTSYVNYFYLGTQVFLTPDVILDASFAAGTSSGVGVGTVLNSTSLDIMLKVRF